MKKLITITILVLGVIFVCGSACAQTAAFNGFCQIGGQFVSTVGTNSTTKVQASYPKCTVTVYITGTTNLAVLNSNASGSPLANPFQANTDGSILFYASTSACYDIVTSASTSGGTPPMPNPFTYTDVCFGGSGGGGGGGINPGTPKQVTRYDSSGTNIEDSTGGPDDGAHVVPWVNGLSVNDSGYAKWRPNGAGCTVQNLLVAYDGSQIGGRSTVNTAPLSSQHVIGVADQGAGCAGSVQIVDHAFHACLFDNQTVIGDAVIASSTTAGNCSDGGASVSGTQVVGRVASLNTGTGTLAVVDFFTGDTLGGLSCTQNANFIYEIPSGTVDGSNVTFAISQTPLPVNSVMLSRNGILQAPLGVDYTLSGTTITFNVAPLTGDKLFVFYSTGAIVASNAVTSVFGMTGTIPNLSGDVSTSGSSTTTLASSGVAAATYTLPTVTFDAKGRATSASSGTAHTTSSILICADTSGSSTAYTCNTTPTFTPVTGDRVLFVTTTSNTTTSATVNVNSLGAKPLAKWQNTTTLAANDMLANKYTMLTYDGTNWEMSTIGNAPSGSVSCSGVNSPGMCLLEEHTASTSATLDFTTTITSSYDEYVCDLIDVTPSTAAQDLQMLVSTNGGSTYDTSANYFTGILYVPNTGATGALQSSSASLFTLFTAIDNTAANGGVSGTIRVFNPLSSSIRKVFRFDTVANQASAAFSSNGVGVWAQNTAINALRFKFASGNIASGTIRCYGITK